MAKKPAKQLVPTAAPAAPEQTKQLAGLRTMHFWAAALLAVQAVAIVVIGTSASVPFTSQYLAVNTLASAISGHTVLAVATRHLFDVRISWLVAKFLLLLALLFLVSALAKRCFEASMAKGVNPFRWLGFGLSSGVIFVLLASLTGIYDFASLLLVFFWVFIGCTLLWLCDFLVTTLPTKWFYVLCGAGTLATIMPWVLLAFGVWGVAMFDGQLPGYVYGLYVTAAVFYAVLGTLVFLRGFRKGRFSDLFFTERVYLAVSFVAASLLAWQVFWGALRP